MSWTWVAQDMGTPQEAEGEATSLPTAKALWKRPVFAWDGGDEKSDKISTAWFSDPIAEGSLPTQQHRRGDGVGVPH